MIGEEAIPSIVLVTGSLAPGGAQRVMSDMANYWTNKGWKVTFATWSGPDTVDFYSLDPAIHRVWLHVHTSHRSLPWKLRSNLARIRKLRAFLSEARPDAVLSFLDTSNVLTIMAARGLKMRVAVSERVHSAYHPLTWPWKVMRKISYRWASVVVVQTRDVAHWLEQTYGIKASVIPNPLRALPDTNIEPRKALVLAVGRLARQKGFDLLLRAFASLREDFADWRVMIVGTGAEQNALLKLCDELDLDGLVEFSQPIKNIETLMSGAGLVVQPSRYEGFPNVVLEAMGMGAAVISADCPSGPAEIIQDGVNGHLVPVDDVEALARCMARLMSQPELRRRLGKEAIKVRESYRQDKIMAAWERCLLPTQHHKS